MFLMPPRSQRQGIPAPIVIKATALHKSTDSPSNASPSNGIGTRGHIPFVGVNIGNRIHLNRSERCLLKKSLVLTCLLFTASCSAFADNFIYGNNASAGSPYIFQIDKTTGAVTNTYTGLSGSNGRGVVVVGSTMYYTSATTNSVYSYNLTTHTNNGIAFTVAAATALSTIAYDGTNFWIGDYSGTNHAYLYTPTGTLLKTCLLYTSDAADDLLCVD